jgi:hypothetical protein
MKLYTQDELKARFAALGFAWPQNHLIGVRNTADQSDAYDDVFYWVEDGKLLHVYSGTTNPGSYYLQTFINKLIKGTAIMASNQQMVDGFLRGNYRGRRCWRQIKPMKIFRDEDKDLRSEEVGIPFMGMFGIHIHAMFATKKSIRIFNWSAACQGMNVPEEWAEFVDRSYFKCNWYLTYTLLKEF